MGWRLLATATFVSLPGQPASPGWSLSASQRLGRTWAVFGRANRASGYVTPVKSSFALGTTIENPRGRSSTDQIGLAIGLSDAAPPPANPAGARTEKSVEAHWSWTFLGGLLVTPDVQLRIDPALMPALSAAWVLSIRCTLML